MDFAEEKLINNDSRKMRMRSHSFSLAFFSDNHSNNTKPGKKVSKKASKKSLQQQNLNDRIPSLPFQYSRKVATQLNGTEKDEDVLITRKSHEWNTRMFRKGNNRMTNESDEFGCCGIPDMSMQSPALSIGSNIESPDSVPNEISTPLDHPACMLFKEHDEDSLDMTTLLDHTLIPIMTTSTTPTAVTRTKMQNEKIQSIKNSIPLYSPSHSSASSASYSSSSAVEFDQSRPSQMQRYTNSKAPKPARSLPSLRSTFSRTQSDSVVDIPGYQDDENCLGLCLNTKMLGVKDNEETINLKQRSPLRERRQKPPLHISTSNPSMMIKSNFSPFSAKTTDSIETSTKMTLRMRRSKVGLFSPPPCPPPTTPLPVLPFLPCDDGSNAGKIERPNGSKEETNKIVPKRQERGLSFQSAASIQFSESSFDSYQTYSRSSYETPKRNSKASLYLSAISSTFSPIQPSQTNEIKQLEEEQDENVTSQSIQVEQTDETIQNPNSDVHIIGYAF